MKTLLAVFFGSALSVVAQQIETYDIGTLYSDILQTNNGAIFVKVSGVGLNGTSALQPLQTIYTLNYFRRGPFDFSIPNSTMEISTFFQIKAPVSTGLSSGIQIGFVQSQTATSFISPGQNGDMSLWVYPTSTTATAGGYPFHQSIDLNVYNGSSTGGTGYGTTANPILKIGEWYKATFRATRDNNTTLDLFSVIEDYGTTGTNYISTIDSVYFQNTTGQAGYPFSYLTSDSTFYPAIAGSSDYGIKSIDNTSMSAVLSPGSALSANLVFQLDFQTTPGKKCYLQASPDLIQWVIVEIVAGNGSLMTRYYPVTSSRRFYRMVQD